MSDLTAETSSEKLVLLLDGELSPTQEVPLFTDLASNDELRAEMRELISIKNIVKNDSEAFIPPFAATSAVFTSAGFSIPGLLSGVGTILLKYSWIPILLAVMTGLVTYGIIDNNFEKVVGSLKSEKVNLQKEINSNNATIAALQSQKNDLQSKLDNQNPTVVIKYVKAPVVKSFETNSDASNSFVPVENDHSYNHEENTLAYSRIADNSVEGNGFFVTPSERNELRNERQTSIYQPMSTYIKVKGDEYYLTFRGLSSLSYPIVNSPTNSPNFSNIAFGFYFLSPYKNITIGGEFGKEPFTQRFINTESNKRYLYEQQPNIWWVGASAFGILDTRIDALFGAQPYGKLFIGGSEIGPMGKIGAGLRWVSSSWGLGAFLGVEGSVLGYQNQGTWYTSGKVGLTYGLSIQF